MNKLKIFLMTIIICLASICYAGTNDTLFNNVSVNTNSSLLNQSNFVGSTISLGGIKLGSTNAIIMTNVTSLMKGRTNEIPTDGAVSNYISTSHLVFSNTYWDDLTFSVAGLGRAGIIDPTESFTGGPAGKARTISFSGTVLQELYGDAQMPHSWKTNTAIRPHFHSRPSTTATGTVVWGVASQWTAINGVTSPLIITNYCTNVISVNSQWKHFIVRDGDLVPPTNAYESSIIEFRIFRDPTQENDNFPDAIDLLDFDLHFQKEKIGSDNEIP